jgi:acyl-CoA thioesterase I
MKLRTKIAGFFLGLIIVSCSNDSASEQQPIPETPNPENPLRQINYLALGDSYTIGQSVCETCRFPAQLKSRLSISLNATTTLKIIAQTGWTTTNLKTAINTQNLASNYDLVTLLIGVNNQYQHQPFSLYEQEFPELLQTAISLAKGDPENVIVVSIPDYAFTPFGQNTSNPETISTEIDAYNHFAQGVCLQNGVQFINITDITREGIQNSNLVASDGLHPSEAAYAKFVERILPKALLTLQD